MAITVNTLTLDGSGWAVNAHADDATSASASVIQAAPGASKNIYLKEVNITAAGPATAFLSSKVSATATANRVLGPLHISSGVPYVDKFLKSVTVTENENLMFTTSGATAVNIYASGTIR